MEHWEAEYFIGKDGTTVQERDGEGILRGLRRIWMAQNCGKTFQDQGEKEILR